MANGEIEGVEGEDDSDDEDDDDESDDEVTPKKVKHSIWCFLFLRLILNVNFLMPFYRLN